MNDVKEIKKVADRASGKKELGATMVEYALLVALIAVIAIGAVGYLGSQVSGKFSEIGSAIAN